VHLLVSLHLVALGDHLSCGILVTLDGCRHLDGLEQQRSLWQKLVLILGHLLMIVRGSCVFPGGAPKATLVDCLCH
jgi:hypothetical protein